MMRLDTIEFRDACQFVNMNHRHHKAPRGHKFSLCVKDDSVFKPYRNAALVNVVGVVIVGRPTAKETQKQFPKRLEVLRVATDGTPNACSKLYNAAYRAIRALHYEELITFILINEKGISLVAADWMFIGISRGGKWDSKNRERNTPEHLQGRKKKYIKTEHPKLYFDLAEKAERQLKKLAI